MNAPKTGKLKLTVYEMCVLALIGALLFVQQIALRGLPNIHLCAPIIIVTTVCYRFKALYSVTVFVLLEGLFYGFGFWWIGYLYVWPLLVIITTLFIKNDSAVIWAVIAAFHGITFGFLCSLPFWIAHRSAVLASWISGIPFDVAHCIGNFVLTLIFYHPLLFLLKKLKAKTFIE